MKALYRVAHRCRIAILLMAIAAMLGVSVASASPAHFHAKAPANDCGLCCTAHVVSLEAHSIAQFVPAPDTEERIAPCAAVAGYQLLRDKAALTRGPPSLCCL
jgi:hypothetical protein